MNNLSSKANLNIPTKTTAVPGNKGRNNKCRKQRERAQEGNREGSDLLAGEELPVPLTAAGVKWGPLGE